MYPFLWHREGPQTASESPALHVLTHSFTTIQLLGVYCENCRVQVCSNFNITFSSECQLQRQVCLCTKNQKGCDSPDFAFLQLEYMGQCKGQSAIDQFKTGLNPDWLKREFEDETISCRCCTYCRLQALHEL